MTTQEQKSLQSIHKLFLDLEKSVKSEIESPAAEVQFDFDKLNELKNKIQALATAVTPEVARLASIYKHLTPPMKLKHFVSFAIPFERLLNKIIQDDEFLVLNTDQLSSCIEKFPLVFVLDNIRSAFNVGSIFRTAECLGAKKLMLCGYTPLPTQRKVEKTAMGTDVYMEWEEAGKLSECVSKLKSLGYWVVGLETAEPSIDLYADFTKRPTAFVLGNERFGLDPEYLKLVDEVRIIPLHGRKNSLNVGVTAAIAGFEWVRQWKKHSQGPN